MQTKNSGVRNAVPLWMLQSPVQVSTSVTCRLHDGDGRYQLRVDGLGVPLGWEFTSRPEAEARAATLLRELHLRGWKPLDGQAARSRTPACTPGHGAARTV